MLVGTVAIPCVLVIDDEPTVRKVLRSMLEREGYTVFVASGGRETGECCRAQPVDLVVVDLFMSNKDAIDIICEV